MVSSDWEACASFQRVTKMRSDMGAIPPRQLRGGEGWELSCVQLGLSECTCLRSTGVDQRQEFANGTMVA